MTFWTSVCSLSRPTSARSDWSVGPERSCALLKMPLQESKQEEIRQAVAAGRTPNRQASGRVTLPLGGKRYAVLLGARGETAQGAFYKTLAGEGEGLGTLTVDVTAGTVTIEHGENYTDTRDSTREFDL